MRFPVKRKHWFAGAPCTADIISPPAGLDPQFAGYTSADVALDILQNLTLPGCTSLCAITQVCYGFNIQEDTRCFLKTKELGTVRNDWKANILKTVSYTITHCKPSPDGARLAYHVYVIFTILPHPHGRWHRQPLLGTSSYHKPITNPLGKRTCCSMTYRTLTRHSFFVHATASLLLFSKLIKLFFGYFEPENIYLDNKNE